MARVSNLHTKGFVKHGCPTFCFPSLWTQHGEPDGTRRRQNRRSASHGTLSLLGRDIPIGTRARLERRLCLGVQAPRRQRENKQVMQTLDIPAGTFLLRASVSCEAGVKPVRQRSCCSAAQLASASVICQAAPTFPLIRSLTTVLIKHKA